jgi:hypothetical protein
MVDPCHRTAKLYLPKNTTAQEKVIHYSVFKMQVQKDGKPIIHILNPIVFIDFDRTKNRETAYPFLRNCSVSVQQ